MAINKRLAPVKDTAVSRLYETFVFDYPSIFNCKNHLFTE